MGSTFYILRHIETGLVMPLFPRNRGYTNWDPIREHQLLASLPNRREACAPRLFTSQAGAIQARSKWAQGVHSPRWSDAGYGPEFDGVMVDEPFFPRSVDDLEIIPVTLEEAEQDEEEET